MTQHSTDQAVAESLDASADAATSVRESLSALVDNEASEMEIGRLLKLAESDPDVRERWKRYQLARSLMHREPVSPQFDLSSRISAAIAEEESLSVSMQTSGRSRQWMHGAGKVAIAACVTFAFVFGFQQVQQQTGGDVAPAAIATSAEGAQETQRAVGNVAPSGFELPPLAARTVSTGSNSAASAQGASPFAQQYSNSVQQNQALQEHFNQLLLKHADRSSSSGAMGLIPFARASQVDAAQE